MGNFILDSSRLEGVEEVYVDSIIEDRGRFLELQWAQGGANQDMEIFGFSVRYAPAETEVMALPNSSFASADYAYLDVPLEDRGRNIQLEWSLGGTDQDLELLGFGLRFAVGEDMSQETS